MSVGSSVDSYAEFFDLETSTAPDVELQRLELAAAYLDSPLVGGEELTRRQRILTEAARLVDRVEDDAVRARLGSQAARTCMLTGSFVEAGTWLEITGQPPPSPGEVGQTPSQVWWDTRIKLDARLGTLQPIPPSSLPKGPGAALLEDVEALRHNGRTPSPWDSWYRDLDLVPLAREIKKSGTDEAHWNLERLRLYLVSRIQLGNRHWSKVQTPRNIKRQTLLVRESSLEAIAVLRVGEALERLETSTLTEERIAALQALDEALARVWDFKTYCFGLAAAAATSTRLGLEEAAAIFRSRFRGFSLALSDGGTGDLCSCLDSLRWAADGERRLSGALPGVVRKVGWRWLRTKMRRSVAPTSGGGNMDPSTIRDLEEYLARDIGAMGGGLLKVSQLGSQIEGLLPDEIRDRLAAAYDQGRPQPFQVIATEMAALLGPGWKESFAAFSPTPFASGSLGQVHRARTTAGEECAVKVLYPDIESRIRDDFERLRKLAWAVKVFAPYGAPEAALVQWRTRCLAECDYEREAAYQTRAREALASVPNLAVPGVLDHLSGKAVLTQEFVDGRTLFDVMETGTEEERDFCGEMIVRSIFLLMSGGLFNYDLHPGNFILRDRVLYCVDFGGCVETAGHGHSFPDLIQALRREDAAAFREAVRISRFYREEDLADVGRIMPRFREIYLKPFLADEPFRFTPQFASEVFRNQITRETGEAHGYVPATQEQVNVRFYWSLYSLLGGLRARADWRRVFEESWRA